MKSPEFTDKAAVVTGGGAGIGREICLALARQGARVLVADLEEAGARQTASVIAKEQAGAAWVQADVSRADQVDRIFKTARSELGGVDLVINNAGVTHPTESILDLDLKHLDRVFAVDYKGVYLCCRQAGRQMIAQGQGGVIINISSIAGITPLPLAVYGPMKSAVNMLTRILAREWAPHGIRVNAVAPGYVLTPLIQGLIDAGQRDPSLIVKQTPMKTMLSPGDVAQAVVFLCSGAAAHMTGVVLPVDGGWLSDGGWAAYPNMAGGESK